MPMRWVQAHLEAMPAIKAEEAFAAAEIAAVGAGRLGHAELARVLRRWDEARGAGQIIKRKVGKGADLGFFAKMGFRVKKAEPSK